MLPGAADPDKRTEPSQTQRKPAPNYKVRMDPLNRTLDSMVAVADPSQIAPFDDHPSKRRGVTDDEVVVVDEDDTPMWNAAPTEDKRKDIPESVCDFTSIHELRRAVLKRASPGEYKKNLRQALILDLSDTLSKHAFVGIVDSDSGMSLIQHSTRLLLVNHAALAYVRVPSIADISDEHFYQLGLRQFGALGRLKLQPAPLLDDLLRLAAEDEDLPSDLSVDTVVQVSVLS